MKYSIPNYRSDPSTSASNINSTSTSTSNANRNSNSNPTSTPSNSNRKRPKATPTKKTNNRRTKIGLDDIDSDTIITVSIDPTNISSDEDGNVYADRELKVRGHVKRDDLYDQHQSREKGPNEFMLETCYSHKIVHLEKTLRTTLNETRAQRDSKFTSLTYEQRTERWRKLLWRIARTDKMPEGELDFDYPVRIVNASEVRKLGEMGYHEFSAFMSADKKTGTPASSSAQAGLHSHDGSGTFRPQLQHEVKKKRNAAPTTGF
ncbi:hypothetical protein I302_104310 [Kwoniella bestiolae CBS 10118]|uniref:Uncharacterized protein n=1 Tax=Kwoniella bestiolae CBS 10118 TaxID=1296100 RepID=A0A1B9GAX7_9TREE|nr:hypothetical protein I302_03018 [Kwoniella bestiolae CBS 10118]OCF28167.1 hypothetical protein I302_03018 [Kwoniella bestiolae CBS 10118]